jgi:hypothetical protein
MVEQPLEAETVAKGASKRQLRIHSKLALPLEKRRSVPSWRSKDNKHFSRFKITVKALEDLYSRLVPADFAEE